MRPERRTYPTYVLVDPETPGTHGPTDDPDEAVRAAQHRADQRRQPVHIYKHRLIVKPRPQEEL